MCCPLPCFSGVKTLGSADDDEESAASWVIRMKSLAEEKKKAEKKVSHSPPPLYNAYQDLESFESIGQQPLFFAINIKPVILYSYKPMKIFLYEIHSLLEHNRSLDARHG